MIGWPACGSTRTSTARSPCPTPATPAPCRSTGATATTTSWPATTTWPTGPRTMDRLGYDTMWLTEHHFQYEGYEVVPNLILFGLHLANQTERLRLGQMFNVVPQWHPLRLAEDFALADILLRRAHAVRRGPGHGAPRGRDARGGGGVGRQRDEPGGRPGQPRDVRGGDGRHQGGVGGRAVQLQRQALHVPAARHPRPGLDRAAAHAHPPAAAAGRDLPGGEQPGHARLRGGPGLPRRASPTSTPPSSSPAGTSSGRRPRPPATTGAAAGAGCW